MSRSGKTSLICLSLILILTLSLNNIMAADPQLKALIIDGQNNHNWKKTTPFMKKILEETGLFTVDVSTSPKKSKKKKLLTMEE